MLRRNGWFSVALAAAVLTCAGVAFGAKSPASRPSRELPAAVFSPDVSTDAILSVMKKVGDWQLANPGKHPTTDWTQGAFYTGLMALARTSEDARYYDAMMGIAKKNEWKLGRDFYHADEHCVGQAYLELFFKYRDPRMIESIRRQFDEIMAKPMDDQLDFTLPGMTNRWSWCDSLFMAPPVWARLAAATGEKKYLDFMNRRWWVTSGYLYDKDEHLYFRDNRFFQKREANGRKVFWSRGNGWVMGGLVRVLQFMPVDYPARSKYVEQFKQMAAKVLTLQGSDGLWRSSLLDSEAYPTPEASGSGFYTYAMAWGINEGLLDRSVYEPAVRKGWQGLVRCVSADGRLNFVQPIGAAPQAITANSTEVYGVGAFLLAGSEMHRLARSVRLPAMP